MKITLLSGIIASVLLTSCLHGKVGEIEDELLDMKSFIYEEQLRSEDFSILRAELVESRPRLPLATLKPTERTPRIYFYRLLMPLSELREADWSQVSSRYKSFPTEYTDWILIFVEDGYDLPTGKEAVKFSDTISYKEFTKLNPNPEGWRFVQLHEGMLHLEKWTDEGSAKKTLTWNQFERKFPCAIILLYWSFHVSEPNKVFVTGVDLSGKQYANIAARVSLNELELSRVIAVAICENREIVVYTERDAISQQVGSLTNERETQ